MRVVTMFRGDASRLAAVLVITVLLSGVAMALLGNWVASRYAGLTLEADSRQRATVLREVVDDILWRRHFETASAAAAEVATEVRPLLADPVRLRELLATVEKRGAFTLGAVNVMGFSVLSPTGGGTAERWLA